MEGTNALAADTTADTQPPLHRSEIREALLNDIAGKGKYFCHTTSHVPPACYLVPPRNITGIVPRSDSTFSSSSVLQLPTYSPSSLFAVHPALCPPLFRTRKSDAVRTKFINPPRVAVDRARSISPHPALSRRGEGRTYGREVRIPRLVQEARTRTVHKTERPRAELAEGGRKWCGFMSVARSTASVVARHARDSESAG